METEVVTDVNADPSPATTENGPSLEDRAYALTGKAREHWMLTGDVDAAEALQPPKDVTTASSADPAEEPSAQVGDTRTPEQRLPKREKKSPDQSFAELRSRAERAEAERDLLQRQMAESRTSPPARTEEAPAPKAQPSGKPKLATYTAQIGDTYATFEDAQEAYDDARDEYRERNDSERQSQAERSSTWNDGVKAAKAAHADFEAVAFSDTPASNVMIHIMQGRKDGAELAYYLGKNPAVAKALAERTEANLADPRSLGRAEGIVELEFDRISESLKKRTVSSRETVLRQPKPTSEVAVEANRAAADDEEADAINRGDTGAYIRIANKRDAERFRTGGY